MKNQLKKYFSLVVSIALLISFTLFYLYETQKGKTTVATQDIKKEKPQKVKALEYDGAMVLGDVDNISDIIETMDEEPSAGGGAFDMAEVASSITAELSKAFSDSKEYSLPLVAQWNAGAGENEGGLDPLYMMSKLEQGEHILVSWRLDAYYEGALGDAYYEESIKKAASLKLPLVFILPSPESALYKDSFYLSLSKAQNPNLVDKSGTVVPKLSPFGPDELWSEIGEQWASMEILSKIQEWYPNPPLVLFVSEDEAKKLSWSELEKSSRYVVNSNDENFQRSFVDAKWIEKYRQMHESFKAAFTKSAWKANTKFISYNRLSEEMGKTSSWMQDATLTNNYINIWPLTADGITVDFTLSDSKTDRSADAPHIVANNLPFMLDEAKEINSNFIYQLNLDDDAKLDNPTAYRGLSQFALWFLRPSIVRQRSSATTKEEIASTFQELVDSVELIHYNTELASFWREGKLLKSADSYLKSNIPEQYKNDPRWFLLDADINPKRPWSDSTSISVWAFALVKGKAPNREWLVYVQSPDGERKDVTVTIPEYKDVMVDSDERGSFVVLEESGKKVAIFEDEKKTTTEEKTWFEKDGVVYGAKPDDRGPIGGGEGYTKVVRTGDYIVTTVDSLMNALSIAQVGEVIFIPGNVKLDFTEVVEKGLKIKIPEGVTLASDRGYNGSKGALLKFPDLKHSMTFIETTGENVRITGLRMEGSNPDNYLEFHKGCVESGDFKNCYYAVPTSAGIETKYSNLEVDNCEISGFSYAGIHLSVGKWHKIHHNFIHHCQRKGLGYGIVQGAAESEISYNVFDWTRHAIAASGVEGSSYIAHDNVQLKNHLTGEHSFDMHADPKGVNKEAGTRMEIYNNTFFSDQVSIYIRGIPRDKAIITKNWFKGNSDISRAIKRPLENVDYFNNHLGEI